METPGPASGSGVPPAVLEPVLAELRAMDDDPRLASAGVGAAFAAAFPSMPSEVSAVAAAVSISGFSEKFFFYGFLPEKKQTLVNDLKKFSNLETSFVFFISPKKINNIIPELKKNFKGRKIVFCREISKLYEEYIRINIDELELFTKELKGELTVVISGKSYIKNASQELSESDKVLIKKMIIY